MNENPLGSRISELLNKSGMTQRELAEKIGVTAASVHRYINGDRTPEYSTIVKIADILGTTSDYLLGLGPGPLKEDEKVGTNPPLPEHLRINPTLSSGKITISTGISPFRLIDAINDIINWLSFSRELMKDKFDRKLLSRIIREFNKRKYAIVNPHQSMYDFKIDTILPGSLGDVRKHSFMIQDCYGIDIGEKYTIVDLVNHPTSFDFNFQEFFDMFIKEMIPTMVSVSEYPIVFITRAYVSTDRFPEDLFYIDDKDASKKKIKLPIDDILKKEHKAFEKLGFVSINDYVQYENSEAFIYPNRVGLKLKDHFTDLLQQKGDQKS